MTERLKCAITSCDRNAIILYGEKWICGYCFMKIYNKKIQEKNKDIEELEKCQ